MKKKIIAYYVKNKLEITIFIGFGTIVNTLLITFGITSGIVQRQKLQEAQTKMQYNDSLRTLKLDSANDALQSVKSIEHTLQLYKK